MLELKKIEIFIGNSRVGTLAQTPENLCAFEYDADWLRSGYSISPFFLPLESKLFVAKFRPFRGGFGVFDDSLPDGWGNLLLDRYLEQQGIDPGSLTLLQRLSFIGSGGRGALEYRPDRSMKEDPEFAGFSRLAANAARLLEGDDAAALEVLYRYGYSSGGARPKVFVHVDGKEWLVKFKAAIDPRNIGEQEYQYSLLAKECGIEMPETRLFDGKYFGVERFDRTSAGRIHTVSASGLLHADYRIPSLDYTTLMKACLALTADMEQVYALFRIMVFNIVIANRDDHAKNFAFQWRDGRWKISPAYDLLPSNGFNGFHTTTVNHQGAPSLNDVLAVAAEGGMNTKRAKMIVEEVLERCRARRMAKIKWK